MNTRILTLAVTLVSMSATAQTVTFAVPCVNPFGYKVTESPCVSVADARPLSIDSTMSFFGLVQSTVETDARTLTYVSLAKNVDIGGNVNLTVRVGDFRVMTDRTSEWANTYLQMSTQALSGTISVVTDWYFPVRNSSTLNLTGVTYSPSPLGAYDQIRLNIRASHVLDAGFVLDGGATYQIGRMSLFVRGVVGFEDSISGGVSVTL